VAAYVPGTLPLLLLLFLMLCCYADSALMLCCNADIAFAATPFLLLCQENLALLSCTAGSTWLQLLVHLGTGLARLQRTMHLTKPSLATAGAGAGAAAADDRCNDPVSSRSCSSNDVALAAAAGILQPVVLAVQEAASVAAAEAVAAPDEPGFMVRIAWNISAHGCSPTVWPAAWAAVPAI
jgi:hypothetical protein